MQGRSLEINWPSQYQDGRFDSYKPQAHVDARLPHSTSKNIDMDNSQNTVLGNSTGSLAMKKFDELTDTEKIERLRNELRTLRYVSQAMNQLRADINDLRVHQHSDNGTVLVKLPEFSKGAGLVGGQGMLFDSLS